MYQDCVVVDVGTMFEREACSTNTDWAEVIKQTHQTATESTDPSTLVTVIALGLVFLAVTAFIVYVAKRH